MDPIAIFLAIGAGIVALAVGAGKVFRRTVNKPMPGHEGGAAGVPMNKASVYGRGKSEDGADNGGGGGGY